jgi:hypothetical protein
MVLHCGGVNGCFKNNFVFEKILEVEIIQFHTWAIKRVKLFLARQASLISSYVKLHVLGLSWVPQWGRPHDVFHVVVHLCYVLNPCLARCRESEVALLTNQVGDLWANLFSESLWWAWKHVIIWEVLQIMANKPCWVVEELSLTRDIICIKKECIWCLTSKCVLIGLLAFYLKKRRKTIICIFMPFSETFHWNEYLRQWRSSLLIERNDWWPIFGLAW